ncbi:hypothetical protein M405DRAFT_870505 [Rhizopogon salebrosus TDB-379]|nr:hypothetical protein M405DRAFT_870505 [Rhizopogon salebrosus TDB-379]
MNHQTTNFYRSSQSQFPMHLAPRPGGPPESYPPQVSPLLTPNGSFKTLLNFAPPLHAPSPTFNAPNNPYATGASALDQMMPTQHLELLRQMWASGSTGMQCPTPPEVMQQNAGVFHDSTAPVVNAGTTATTKKSRKRKNPVQDVDGTENIGTRGRGSKKRKMYSGAAALPQTATHQQNPEFPTAAMATYNRLQ